MIEVIMPKMGDGMEEGTLVDWTVKEGDKVKSGDIIGNIQTDKATVELTSPSSGAFAGPLIKEGDTVPVGAPIAAILKEGEKLPEGWGNGQSSKPQAAAEAAPDKPGASVQTDMSNTSNRSNTSYSPEPTSPTPQAAAQPTPQPTATAPAANGGRVFASPLARKMAQDAGLAIESIHGTGPEGRIVERDVKAAVASGGTTVAAPAVAAGLQPAKTTPAPQITPQSHALEDRFVTLTNLQRITGERTAHSKTYVPHYYVTVEVDLEALEAVRNHFNEDDPERKLSINDFIIKACALALQEQPHINASFEDGKRHEHGAINIGVAAAVANGLTVPVIRNCESKSLRQIAVEVRTLIAKARDNKLHLDELTGSTFSISNMGMFDVENFSAIINEPNGAIIAVSSAKRIPVAVSPSDPSDKSDLSDRSNKSNTSYSDPTDSDLSDYLEIRTRMKITGSFDHRIIDGAVGAVFMGVVKKYLEHPTLLLN